MSTASVADRMRARVLPHAVAFFVMWPLASAIAASATLAEQRLTENLPITRTLMASLYATVRMIPEFMTAASLLMTVSVVLFAWCDRTQAPAPRLLRIGEAALAAFASGAGIATEYPALLRHPLLQPFRGLATGTVTLLLLALVIACGMLLGFRRGGIGAAMRMSGIAAAFTVAFHLLAQLPLPQGRQSGRDRIVLLGIDSLSQYNDVRPLRRATRHLGGTWYERPVTPGLLTNSVWPAILMQRPVHETGTFFVFQRTDWTRAPFSLIREASRRGFDSWSFFSDQMTMTLGPDAGFAQERNGPEGWLQLATAEVKNASVLLPVVLRRLPRIPFATTPANQSGTFAHDVRREIAGVLTAGDAERKTFIAAHVDYLHQSLYPSYSEMSSVERRRVWNAPVGAIRDESLHYQYPRTEGEPLEIYGWKIARIQRLVIEELLRSRFLESQKRNRLVIFSDHGARINIGVDTFTNPVFHRVPFVTFGIPPRDPQRPISLLDIAPLLGLGDPSRTAIADPVVEFSWVTDEEWFQMMNSAKLELDGDVHLDGSMLRRIGDRILAHRPYTTGGIWQVKAR